MADLNSTTIYGYLHVHETAKFNADVNVAEKITAKRVIITQPNDGFDSEGITSTPPLTVVSKGWVENLNVDLLDNQHGDYYLDLTNATNYLSDDRLAVNTISLNKLKYINAGRLLGRGLENSSGPVIALEKTDAKPILDLLGTNRGDQAVFNAVNLIDSNGNTVEGPRAVAPLSYDDAIVQNPLATLETLIGNKDILSIKSGKQVSITNTSGVENCITIKVGLTLENGLFKGSVNTDTPTGKYTAYTSKQSIMSFDTGGTVPTLLDKLNLNGAFRSSNIYVSDLVMAQESSSWVSDNNKYSQVLTTKKSFTQINATYPIAFFSPQTTNKFGEAVGSDIVKSEMTVDDNQYTANNLLTASKIKDDFEQFKIDNIDSRIYGAVGNLDILLSLNVDSLEDGVIILVKTEGLYRLSKIETEYTEQNSPYVISVPNNTQAKWIKIAETVAYHNKLGNIQGGSSTSDEYYHVTSHQFSELHDKQSDNQQINPGLGMDFVGGNGDVTIAMGMPETVTTTSINAIKQISHSHVIEAYELDAVSPISVSDGVKVLGNRGVIRVDIATEDGYGVVRITDDYTSDSVTHVPTSLGLKNGLASVVNPPSNGKTVIGYIPTWETNSNIRRLTTGYSVSANYTAFKNADVSTLTNSIVRADIIKQYVDNLIEDQSIFTYKGTIDCSTNPNYPDAGAGDTYVVSVAGKIGGNNGAFVEAGDMLICNVARDDDPNENAGTQEEVGDNWTIIQTNIHGAVVNTELVSTTGNFPVFDGATGRVIKDSGYNYSTFQPKHIILDNLSANTTTGIMCFNSANNSWYPRNIVTKAVGTSEGITITNPNGIAGNIIIQHYDTSSQASVVGITNLTWIKDIELDDYGHVVKLVNTTHPTTTAKTINFAAEGLTSSVLSGISVIETLNVVNDTNCHVTTLNSTSKYLPIATSVTNGVLTASDWAMFNDKVDGPTTSTQGYVPKWNNTSGKLLDNGFAVENDVLDNDTINANTLPTTNLLNKYTEHRLNYLGAINGALNASYPTGVVGDLYIVSQTGMLGGVAGDVVYSGDIVMCIEDDNIGDSANWVIYRKAAVPQRKVITAIGGESQLVFEDIAGGMLDYNMTLYKNGVYQLEAEGNEAYDYTLNKENRIITLTIPAETGERYAIIVEAK